ncbi:MAG: DNA translocase FtsK [Candidatus Ornithospirochaeta sp.]
MKKRRFSLVLSILMIVSGLFLAILGVLSGLGILPQSLSSFALSLSQYLSLTGSEGGLLEVGIFLIFDALVVLICRGRYPFSMFFAIYLWPMYATLLSAVRVFNGTEMPVWMPGKMALAHPGLLFVLFVLEALLSLVLLASVRTLDEKWRKKRDVERRMLEKEGVLKTKESIAQEKLLKRQKKLNEVEEKKRAKEEARYEKERARAEKAENEARSRIEEKERRKYEKDREKAQEKKEKEERRLKARAEKEKDKILEESQNEKERLDAKSARIAKKKMAEDEKKKRQEEEEERRREEEYIGPPPEYEGGIGNPNTPLVFPDFDPMPQLKNILRGNSLSQTTDDDEEYEGHKEEKTSGSISSPSIMDSLLGELEREEETTARPEKKSGRYTVGGMLESTLESAMMDQNVEVERPQRPIIGFEDTETSQPAQTSSFAPSGLSPDHPRYKYFEALEKPRESADVSQSDEKQGGVSAPSSLSPNHPRYKYFEELSRSRSASGVPETKEEKKDDVSPSYLSPDHPRRKLFEALKNDTPSTSSVSYIPQRPFVPEDDTPSQMTAHYEDVVQKKEEKVVPVPPKVEKESKASILEMINASVREENMRNLEEMEKEKEEETASSGPAASFVPPSTPSVREKTENEDGTKTISLKSHEEEEVDFNLCVGVGDLASNIAGYTAIAMRQNAVYTAPPVTLLKEYPGISQEIDEYTFSQGKIIVQTLAEQKIVVELSNIIKGPTVTMYELKLAQGMLISKIKAREDELNYALGGKKIRILAPVPGKQAVGIEVPNAKTSIVGFKDMIDELRKNESYMKMRVPMILGKTITGDPIVIDVAKMPHMIIAGTTGSGKSVCINSLVNTIIYQKSPKDVRLIMVDPKVVELTVYDGIPHLLTPVITDAKRAIKALDWLVGEMERRYSMLARYGVRNIMGLNEKIESGEVCGVERVPYILLIMDEFADIIAVVGKEMDIAIGRIAAKARAAGIHMILATQRPSADVITGTLKSNLPGRIAFAVSSGINSRVILDEMGAENLLGKGDMFLLDPSQMGTKRIQGAFTSDGEVEAVSAFARKNNSSPDFLDESIFQEDEPLDDDDMGDDEFEDGDTDLYEMAKKIVFERRSASASYLQRRLKIGYNRAARIVEMMEEDGIVGPANGSKPREVLRFD